MEKQSTPNTVEKASTTKSSESKSDSFSLRPGGGFSLFPGGGFSLRPGGNLGAFSSANKPEAAESSPKPQQNILSAVGALKKDETKGPTRDHQKPASEFANDPKNRRYDRNFLKRFHGMKNLPPGLRAIRDQFPELVPKQTLFESVRSRQGQNDGRRQSKPRQKTDKDHKKPQQQQAEFLRKAETPWTPSVVVTQKDHHIRTLQGILNKITPQTFDRLTEKICQLFLEIEDVSTYENSVGLVFDKAVSEPNFSTLYTRLCAKLVENSPSLTSDEEIPDAEGQPKTKQVNFKTFLLNKCQQEFENQTKDLKETKPQVKELDDEAIALAKEKAKRRKLGNIKFIGELFKAKLLSDKIIHDCIRSLFEEIFAIKQDLSMKQEEKDDSLENVSERLCKLMSTIGSMIDIPKAKHYMDYYFKHIENLEKDNTFSARIRFMFQDLLELRTNNWVPRRQENVPKTITEVHQEAKQKAFEEEYLSNYSFSDRTNGRKKKPSGAVSSSSSTSTSKGKQPKQPPKAKTSKSKKEINFEDELEMVLKEFFTSNDTMEAVSCIKNLVEQCGQHSKVVETAILTSAEQKNRERLLTNTLFSQLLKENVINRQQFEQGFKDIASLIPELVIDIPLLKKYLQEFLNKAISMNLISLSVGNQLLETTK